MLKRLRHWAIVGGDDDQRRVDAHHARQHIVHKSLVPRHVDKANRATGVEGTVGKAEIDRHAPSLLFRQTIGIDTGERSHQRGLTVIDVAGSRDYHGGMSTNPYQPPNADVNRADAAPGSLPKAVLTGVGIDIGGTILMSFLATVVMVGLLASEGRSESEIQSSLGGLDVFSGFGLMLSIAGLAMSFIGGYWCAKIANRTTYLAPTLMAAVSLVYSLVFGSGQTSWPVTLALIAISIVAIYVGAWRAIAQITARQTATNR